MKNEIEEIKSKSKEIQIDYKEITNSKEKDTVFDTIINEAINFEFKNVNNIILLVINCIMPSTLILFLEKRELFIKIEFPKLILLVISINLILLYSLALIRYLSGNFYKDVVILKALFSNFRFNIEYIKLHKIIKKIEFLELRGKNIDNALKKGKIHINREENLINKAEQYIKQYDNYSNKSSINKCFEDVLFMNIIISFGIVCIKVMIYIFDMHLMNKYWIILPCSIYFLMNITVIIKLIVGMFASLFSNILSIFNKILSKRIKTNI